MQRMLLLHWSLDQQNHQICSSVDPWCRYRLVHKGQNGFMTQISLLIILVGLISTIVPLRFLGIGTRLRGLTIAGLGLALLILTPSEGSEPTSPTISDLELKERTQRFDFKGAARNPDQCKGKLVHGNGKVIRSQRAGAIRSDSGSTSRESSAATAPRGMIPF